MIPWDRWEWNSGESGVGRSSAWGTVPGLAAGTVQTPVLAAGPAVPGKHFPQMTSRAVQTDGEVVPGESQFARHQRGFLGLEVDLLEDLTISRREGGQEPPEASAQIPDLSRFWQVGQGPFELFQGPGTCVTSTIEIDDGPSQDAIEPRHGPFLVGGLALRFQGLDQTFLDEVFGQVGIADSFAGKGDERFQVPQNDIVHRIHDGHPSRIQGFRQAIGRRTRRAGVMVWRLARWPGCMKNYTCPMHPEVEQDHPGDCPKCGMALEPKSVVAESQDDDGELRDLTRRFWWGAILTLPVFVVAMAHLVPAWRHADWVHSEISRCGQFLLTTPVVAWAGWPFFVRGWRSVVRRSLNMFTLIALGVGAAYLFSAAALLFPAWFPPGTGHAGKPALYFEAASVITVLVLLGQVLELRARQRTGGAIRSLLALAPEKARRVTPQGDEEVTLDQVRPGDVLRVRPGEKVPVDGVVVEGRTAIDESMLTGESLPVGKEPGAAVTAGTLNTTGSLVMRAERVGGETVLARIVDLVAHAQRSRAPIQALADKVAAWFVPAVLVVAAATFVGWLVWGPEPRLAYAITNAVAVLIIACPCALGLATPMSIMVGVGRGAQAGVLIRNAEAIEKLARLDTLVVDKTGTLTEGKPALTQVLPVPGFDEAELLHLAASLEQASEHPLARAVTQAVEATGVRLSAPRDFQSRPGAGVSGIVEGRRVLVGKPGFLRDQGVNGVGGLEELAAPHQAAGAIVVMAAIDGRAAGVLTVHDPVKPSAAPALAELNALGVRVVMLTGDHPGTAGAVARALGITEYQAGVTPQEKHRHVKSLQATGRVVGMAGDGINDAPALAAADVGIAMGTGTDIAMESAGVTLVKGDLRGLVRAVRLGRALMTNIRQNLVFAFGYNALGIPLAAGALYPLAGVLMNPMIAGVAMSLSSVSVIANALRLRKTRLDRGDPPTPPARRDSSQPRQPETGGRQQKTVSFGQDTSIAPARVSGGGGRRPVQTGCHH